MLRHPNSAARCPFRPPLAPPSTRSATAPSYLSDQLTCPLPPLPQLVTVTVYASTFLNLACSYRYVTPDTQLNDWQTNNSNNRQTVWHHPLHQTRHVHINVDIRFRYGRAMLTSRTPSPLSSRSDSASSGASSMSSVDSWDAVGVERVVERGFRPDSPDWPLQGRSTRWVRVPASTCSDTARSRSPSLSPTWMTALFHDVFPIESVMERILSGAAIPNFVVDRNVALCEPSTQLATQTLAVAAFGPPADAVYNAFRASLGTGVPPSFFTQFGMQGSFPGKRIYVGGINAAGKYVVLYEVSIPHQ